MTQRAERRRAHPQPRCPQDGRQRTAVRLLAGGSEASGAVRIAPNRNISKQQASQRTHMRCRGVPPKICRRVRGEGRAWSRTYRLPPSPPTVALVARKTAVRRWGQSVPRCGRPRPCLAVTRTTGRNCPGRRDSEMTRKGRNSLPRLTARPPRSSRGPWWLGLGVCRRRPPRPCGDSDGGGTPCSGPALPAGDAEGRLETRRAAEPLERSDAARAAEPLCRWVAAGRSAGATERLPPEGG